MVNAFFLALGQLGDKAILGVFLKSVAVTLVLFAGLGAGLWFGVDWLIGWLGFVAVSDLAATLALLLALIPAWILFRAVAVAVVGIFGDEVVHAVEARYYPQALASARPVPFGRALAMGLGSVARVIGWNLLLSPLYLVLIVTGVGTFVALFLVNAWLMGRDMGDMVAARHMGGKDLPGWRGGTRMARFGLGAAGTALLLVPFVNLVAPVLTAAMATHMFHRGRNR